MDMRPDWPSKRPLFSHFGFSLRLGLGGVPKKCRFLSPSLLPQVNFFKDGLMSTFIANFLDDDARERMLRRLGRALLISAPVVIVLQLLVIDCVLR